MDQQVRDRTIWEQGGDPRSCGGSGGLPKESRHMLASF